MSAWASASHISRTTGRRLVTSASDDPLAVLAALGDAADHLQRWRLDAVTRARKAGRSWAEIGEALGVCGRRLGSCSVMTLGG